MAKGPRSAHSPSSSPLPPGEMGVEEGLERAVTKAVAVGERMFIVGVGVIIAAVAVKAKKAEEPYWAVEV